MSNWSPSRGIVQALRLFRGPSAYSLARFELLEQDDGTRVILGHTGFPPEKAESLASGWNENYWTPLRKYLG